MMKKSILSFITIVALSCAVSAQGVMDWVFIPPGEASTTQLCNVESDCDAQIYCYLLKYWPGYYGVFTTYTTGYYHRCTFDTVTATSCIMNDNTWYQDQFCGQVDSILTNASGNQGTTVHPPGDSIFIHKMCIEMYPGRDSIIFEPDFQGIDLTVSWTDPDTGFVTDYPSQVVRIFQPSVDCIVPVQYMSFTAKAVDNHSELNWTTKMEENCKKFDIERADRSLVFTKIGEVDSQGDSHENQSYVYLDKSPLEGKNYYRIRQWDHDGTNSYSDIKMVDFADLNIKIYPSIVRDRLYIDGTPGRYKARFFNSSGSQVKYHVLNQNEINVSDLANGAYIVEILNQYNDVVRKEKIVKQ